MLNQNMINAQKKKKQRKKWKLVKDGGRQDVNLPTLGEDRLIEDVTIDQDLEEVRTLVMRGPKTKM